MSWRAECKAAPLSHLSAAEKDFLKVAKKLRDVLKLEEKRAAGEPLLSNQEAKIDTKDELIAELLKHAKLMPPRTETVDKNQDVINLLPPDEVSHLKVHLKQQLKAEEVKEKKEERRFEMRHELERRNVEPQKNHSRPITAVVFDPATLRVYTASKDKFIIEWILKDGAMLAKRTLSGHDGSVWGIDLLDSDLLSVAADGNLCLFPGTGKEVTRPLRTITMGGVAKRIATNKDECDTKGYIVIAGDKMGQHPAYVTVLKPDLSEVWRKTEFPTKCTSVAWGYAGGNPVLTAHEDGRVAVWETLTGNRLTVIHLHDGPITQIQRCGTFLCSASEDCSGKVVDLTTKQFMIPHKVMANRPLRTCAYDGRGTIVYSGGREDKMVALSANLPDEFEIFIRNEESLHVTQGAHFGPVHQLIFQTDTDEPDFFFGVSEDGTFKYWDTEAKMIAQDKIRG